MIVGFRDNETQKICCDENYARKKFSPNAVKQLKRLMLLLVSYEKFNIFRYSPIGKKYNIHELYKDRKVKEGTISLSIDHTVRMTVNVLFEINTDKITILEVSTHYGN